MTLKAKIICILIASIAIAFYVLIMLLQFKSKKLKKIEYKEKERAEEIFAKFKQGGKVSTEEILLLQKYNIG